MSSRRSGRRFFRSKSLYPLEIMDPVIDAILEREYVDNVQIAEAYEIRQQVYQLGAPEPAWRCLTTLPGMDRDVIYRIAAEVYDYKRFETPAKELVPFIKRIVPCFTDEQWRGMATIPVVPIKRQLERKTEDYWVFAAHDPTSKQAHDFAYSLVGKEYVLYQSDRAIIARLLAEVFLSKMELPPNKRNSKRRRKD